MTLRTLLYSLEKYKTDNKLSGFEEISIVDPKDGKKYTLYDVECDMSNPKLGKIILTIGKVLQSREKLS